MEDREEDGPLDGELEAAPPQELLDHMLAAGLLPEPLEDQSRADAAVVDDRESPLGVSGEEQDRLGQSRTRGEQSIELAGSAGVDRAVPRWRRRVAGSDHPPSGSRRSGDRMRGPEDLVRKNMATSRK